MRPLAEIYTYMAKKKIEKGVHLIFGIFSVKFGSVAFLFKENFGSVHVENTQA
jgi:hypothetical protein